MGYFGVVDFERDALELVLAHGVALPVDHLFEGREPGEGTGTAGLIDQDFFGDGAELDGCLLADDVLVLVVVGNVHGVAIIVD